MRSNVNFGTALIPEDILVNSGSIWHHTFTTENVFQDPIPAKLREETNLMYNECQTNTASAIDLATLEKTVKNTTLTQIMQVTNDTCLRILEIAKHLMNKNDY